MRDCGSSLRWKYKTLPVLCFPVTTGEDALLEYLKTKAVTVEYWVPQPLFLNCELQLVNKTLDFTQLSPLFTPLFDCVFERVCAWVCVSVCIVQCVWDGSVVVHRGMDNVPAFSTASEENMDPWTPEKISVFYVKTHSSATPHTFVPFTVVAASQINLPADFRSFKEPFLSNPRVSCCFFIIWEDSLLLPTSAGWHFFGGFFGDSW